MKPYFTAPIYCIPLQYAADLVRLSNKPIQEAIDITYDRYGFYGKRNNKRLKEFRKDVLAHHLHKYLALPPNTPIMRRSNTSR